jgi:hypothetical protein
MDASNYIALAALIVAILVAIRGESSLRAERKDRRKEDSRRDEELGLLRSQVEGEAAHRLSERKADLICRQGGRSSVGEGVDACDVLIVNGGRATARRDRLTIPGGNPSLSGELPSARRTARAPSE